MLNKFESLSVSSRENTEISNNNNMEKKLNQLHSHSLIYINYIGKSKEYINCNWICNICRQSYNKNIPNYYCRKCNYDVCDDCFENYNQFYIGQKKMSKYHEHSLNYTDYLGKIEVYKKGNWICNICKKNYSQYIPNFHCEKCNFDICNNCSDINN